MKIGLVYLASLPGIPARLVEKKAAGCNAIPKFSLNYFHQSFLFLSTIDLFMVSCSQ